jgi:hypothetical protein
MPAFLIGISIGVQINDVESIARGRERAIDRLRDGTRIPYTDQDRSGPEPGASSYANPGLGTI